MRKQKPWWNDIVEQCEPKLVKALRSAGPMSKTQVYRVFGGNLQEPIVTAMLESLKRKGQVKVWRDHGNGHARTMCALVE